MAFARAAALNCRNAMTPDRPDVSWPRCSCRRSQRNLRAVSGHQNDRFSSVSPKNDLAAILHEPMAAHLSSMIAAFLMLTELLLRRVPSRQELRAAHIQPPSGCRIKYIEQTAAAVRLCKSLPVERDTDPDTVLSGFGRLANSMERGFPVNQRQHQIAGLDRTG